MQYGFHFEGSRCIGCRTCVFACKDFNHLSPEVTYRKVYEYEGGSWSKVEEAWAPSLYVYHLSLACNHCDDPACTKVCPTEAMRKDAETGLVTVDADRCIGCGYCAMACPYGVPVVDREKGYSVKCDGCAERVAEGKSPVCVESCSLRCLDFGPVDELRTRYGSEAGIAPLPDPDFTHPNLCITSPASARPWSDTDGIIANKTEVL